MDAKHVARFIGLAAIFIIPFAPLVVADNFLFPFITGKAFYLRILIEIVVVSWAVIAFLDRNYRPRISWIGAAVLAFVCWMFVADLFAINSLKAFWSNFERMEGWIFLAHLAGFFFASSAILGVEKKWRAWFLTSVGASAVISMYAILQLAGAFAIHQGSTRIDASFGNSAYLAVYLIFSVFIAAWLSLTERRIWLKRSLIGLAVLEGVLVFFTETRGAIIGLAISVALAAILFVFAAGRTRKLSIAILALMTVTAGGLFLARDSSFVQNNHTLQRVTSISIADGATRFTVWSIAWRGFLERPLTGWGQEGFNHVFNKYYDPSLYEQEQWFDRAHNAFIDWLSAGGLPGFVFYLALFGSAIALLWNRSGLPRSERVLFTSAFVGYAIHNLFVFDNLYSYVYFFAVLAFIDSQVAHPVERLKRLPELDGTCGTTYALPIAGVAVFALIWFVNVPGMRAATGIITALTQSSESPASNIAAFTNLAARPAFAAQEIREQLVAYSGRVVQSAQASFDQKQAIVALAINEMAKQTSAYPLDARGQLQLAYAYRTAGDLDNAIAAVRAALALSPNKEQFWLELGAAEWDAGNIAVTKDAFNTAYELGPQFLNLAAYAAAGDIAAGDFAAADKTLEKAFGTTDVDSDILAVAYYRAKKWDRLISMWEKRTARSSSTVQDWFSLASVFYESGDNARAISTLSAAAERFPDASSSATAVIRQIQSRSLNTNASQ